MPQGGTPPGWQPGSGDTGSVLGGGGGGGGSSGNPFGAPPIVQNVTNNNVFTTSGGVGFSQAGFDSLLFTYQQIGHAFGYDVTKSMAQALLNGSVSPDEFQQRLLVNQRVSDNKVFFQRFQATLDSLGVKANFNTPEAQRAFILGEAAPEFYHVWAQAAGETSAVQAGFTITTEKGDLNLSSRAITGLETKLGLTGPNAGQAEQALDPILQKTAQYLQQYGAIGRMQGMGLDPAGVAQVAAGVGNAKTAQKLQFLINSGQLAQQGVPTSIGQLGGLSGTNSGP